MTTTDPTHATDCNGLDVDDASWARTLFGHMLRSLRRDRGLGQEAVAQACGWSRTKVVAMEQGLTPPPGRGECGVLAELLSHPVAALWGAAAESTLARDADLWAHYQRALSAPRIADADTDTDTERT